MRGVICQDFFNCCMQFYLYHLLSIAATVIDIRHIHTLEGAFINDLKRSGFSEIPVKSKIGA
jgi:hypothetical protein